MQKDRDERGNFILFVSVTDLLLGCGGGYTKDSI